MVKYEFWLLDEDSDRLFEVKNKQRKLNDMTGNDFAKMLLERELHRLHPGTVKQEFDDY